MKIARYINFYRLSGITVLRDEKDNVMCLEKLHSDIFHTPSIYSTCSHMGLHLPYSSSYKIIGL